MLYFFAIIISPLLSKKFKTSFRCSGFCASSNFCVSDMLLFGSFFKSCSLSCAMLKEEEPYILNFCANISKSSFERLFKSFFLDIIVVAFIKDFTSCFSFSEKNCTFLGMLHGKDVFDTTGVGGVLYTRSLKISSRFLFL